MSAKLENLTRSNHASSKMKNINGITKKSLEKDKKENSIIKDS